MKKIALAMYAMGVSGFLLAAPNATIQYCDNNRAIAVTAAIHQVEVILPDIVDSYLDSKHWNPDIVTNNTYHIEYYTNQPLNVTLKDGGSTFLFSTNSNFAICGDMNIYALSNAVEKAVEMESYGIIGVPNEYAWVHMCDSKGNTYTIKNSYILNTSPRYYYYRYTMDGGSQVLVGTGANAVYTNGLVIIKRAVYDQYQLAVYGNNAELVGYTPTPFGISLLDSGDSITIEGVSYRAKNSYVPYGAPIDRLVTTNSISYVVTGIWNSITNWVETNYQRK